MSLTSQVDPVGACAAVFKTFCRRLNFYHRTSSILVYASTCDFQNLRLLDQVKLVYPRDQQANPIILSHQARQEQLDSWQLGAKRMEK